MNKKELIDAVAAKTNSSKVVTSEFIEAFLETVTETLVSGDSVKLIGFGNFEVKNRQARISRNPKTGAEIKVPATKVPSFKAGSKLKEEVKGK